MNRRDSEPPRGGRRPARVLALVTFVLACAPSFTRADEILAHGTGEMFWVARVVEPAPGSGQGLRTVVRGRAVGADGQWIDVAQLPSRVTSLAHRGTQLAALLDSGAWMLLWPGGSSVGAQPPDGARLLALASNDDAVWAIGAGGAEPPATASSATVHPQALALYRLDRGQWTRVAPLPPHDITVHDVARASLSVIGGNPSIAIPQSGGAVEVFAYQSDSARWDTLQPLRASDPARIKLLSDGGARAIVWLAPESGAGGVRLADRGGWTEPRELRTAETIPPGAPRTVAWAGGSVRLLFIRERTTFEQAFADDGAPRTDARPLRTTGSTSTNALPGRVVTLAAAAMLLMVVLSSMRRAGAGQDGAAPAAGAPRVVPAPLLPRALAGLIDLLPLGVACWFVFRDIDPNTQTIDDLVNRTSRPFYFALAGYLLYTWLSEAIFARTIGKALLGLRVASLDGSRAGPVAIFVRNALRLIDVTMLGVPLLLVLLSPLRQRVGDIAARTTVVSARVGDAAGAAKDVKQETDARG